MTKRKNTKEYIQLVADNELIIDDKIKEFLNSSDIFVDLIDDNIIKFYSNRKLILSTLYPILDSIGFEVEKQVAFEIESIFVAKFTLINIDSKLINKNSEHIKSVIAKALNGEMPTKCKLLGLAYRVNFSLREIKLFRALAEYQDQLNPEYNFTQIINRLMINYLPFTKHSLEYFKMKFDPTVKDRESQIKKARKKLLRSLRDIESINDDKMAKMLLLILDNIVRTNYYLKKETISFKIETKNIKHLLKGTQPNIEAFVFSKDIAGVHLRTGYVCRGGLRWSDRYSDYREEVKSLMTAQEAKNAVIVPNGSKGGFIIRDSENITMERFTQCYSSYINGLLDLVNNEDGTLKDDKVIAYDGKDTYFVVAADKGTASMSDVANDIAIKRGFWLKDSFASGGNNGYHHKKLGITAKGALKSTHRFFIEKGIDFYKEPITVVGVGSMGGDVFGNGMIESKYFKVVGAISEKDIFIDPNPDPLTSYKERKRLFEADNSHWSEYKKFSKGGGVFSRNNKSIELTPEIKELLDYHEDTIGADELARRVLTLKVDMLYNGGIGTYIKSIEESNLEIGDKENEFVRVDASDIRAFAICEGANLSVTQKARIEYALNGGKINLDSIDNSAGVDTSDHEVNFKILFNILEKRGLLNEGHTLLKDSTEFVVMSVLNTNYRQALAISLDEQRSKESFDSFGKVVEVLSENLEFFNKRSFQLKTLERYDNKIVRPALGILILYSKIFIQQLLLESDMIESKAFDYYLHKYFPKELLAKFEDKVALHPLRKEIIAMIVSNKIINATGSSFISDYNKLGNDKFLQKIKSYLILNRLFDATQTRRVLFKSDFKICTQKQYKTFIMIENSIAYALNSMIELNKEELNFGTILSYKNSIDRVLKEIVTHDSIKYENLDQEIALFLNMIKHIKFIAEILKIEFSSTHTFNEVIETFFYISKKLKIVDFATSLDEMEVSKPSEIMIRDQLDIIVRSLTSKVTKDLLDFKRKDESVDIALEKYLQEIDFDFDYYCSLHEKSVTLIDISIAVNYLTVKISK
ncbi:NAD-specific glutamate dehydrogenase, large form [hydrothermal vent metagenome]|uniref:NAD-specific glutamate dehydrogenase, large form n=1 Tax=hydrothermal vent metagenome TaxID=652676 RepID=A0A1W1CNI0_9ZZZZ